MLLHKRLGDHNIRACSSIINSVRRIIIVIKSSRIQATHAARTVHDKCIRALRNMKGDISMYDRIILKRIL